jgi:U3 small nucleolar RNA-associated protein 19
VFTRTWLALLQALNLGWSSSGDGVRSEKADTGGDGEEARKLTIRALNVMHRGVMPHLTRAVLVMDWVAGCVDYGGTVGLLALNALFVLMTEYNLDYPSFYIRLYAFLDRDVLHSKHRARFFRMTEVFLGSTHLPATLLASFIKRLSRLSLNAPPAAIVMVIPFTYNILKRHPALMVMVHRVPAEDDDVSSTDPFNADELNPNLTNALTSSLWELYSHKRHYHAGVSTLARVFEEAFTKMPYAMEDFLDHGYGTLLDTEIKRKIKKEPALAVEMRSDAFTGGDGAQDDQVGIGDVVSDLWSFS